MDRLDPEPEPLDRAPFPGVRRRMRARRHGAAACLCDGNAARPAYRNGTTMNKLVKGGLAAAAGIALLMGGAGSLAYWNSSSTAASGAIQTGHLKLTAGTVSGWSKAHLVPGDTDTYTQHFTLDMLGDDIKVSLATSVASPTGTLPAGVTVTTAYTVDGQSWDGSTKEFANAATAATHDVVVTVSVAFASSATGSMDAGYTPGAVTVTATQHA